MLHQNTLATLKTLKLPGMAAAFEEQLVQPVTQSLSFNDRFGLIVDREASYRDNQKLGRLPRPHHQINRRNYAKNQKNLTQREHMK